MEFKYFAVILFFTGAPWKDHWLVGIFSTNNTSLHWLSTLEQGSELTVEY